ncbi:MAG: hypothetical protein NVSMB3_05590 [Acidobacteriaceae bacterium]
MKKLIAVLAVAVVSLSATSLRADLLGTKVTGSLTFSGGTTNYFDPAFGFVPAGFGNSVSPVNVTIGSGVEFGFNDFLNRDTANFSASHLVVRDICHVEAEFCPGSGPFKMTSTDPAFTSATLLTNELGVSFLFAGDVLTVNFPGGLIPDNNATATFLIGSATGQTPEPGTMGLVGTGLLAAAGAVRRRFAA